MKENYPDTIGIALNVTQMCGEQKDTKGNSIKYKFPLELFQLC